MLDLARPGSASPPESRLRLLCTLDARLPEPLLNTWVLDADGRGIAVPDLLDPTSGLVAEYDGEGHAEVRRRTRDAGKDDLHREAGLEHVRVTALDMRTRGLVVDRLARAHRRALSSSRPRRWGLGDPYAGAPVSRTGRRP